MKTLPFTKAEAVGNDFLVVDWNDLQALGLVEADLGPLAKQMCDRHHGVGADGVEYVFESTEADAHVRLFNSDASEAEISGNGTRCVAAWLVDRRGECQEIKLSTAAGIKPLQLLECTPPRFLFDMGMGLPKYQESDLKRPLQLSHGAVDATILNVGNPQCVLFTNHFGIEWRRWGAEIETLPEFPHRTNVSFVRIVDEHTIDVRFWERGAGETLSSGTGATGAAAAAILTGRIKSPVRVETSAGQMDLRWDDQIYLRGPARLIARGDYLFEKL
ncbi:MAG: diaminopimelate epimerase [Acidobacteria bacterium]|nr:diaminopimelate epimerase [Acidobacteriota bacterium]MDA1235908.1 diaminopimelate epimerase [Acidobacteriota bacterium]